MFAPNEIAEKKFDKTVGFGYKMDQVEEYLEEVASHMEQLAEEKKELEKKLEILADKLEEYREDEDSLRAALLGAQKLGDGVIRESKTKAEIIMRDATIKAEKMVDSARRQIEQEQTNLSKMQKEVANFKNRLFALYRQHLEIIGALPGDEEAPTPVAEPAKAQPTPQAQAVEEAAAEAPAEEAAATVETESEEKPRPFKLNLDPAAGGVEGESEERPRRGESRFGGLKFGEGFDLTRNDEVTTRKRK